MRLSWSLALSLILSAPAAAANAAACAAAYDFAAMGVKEYRDPVLASAISGLKRRDFAKDVAEVMDKSDTSDQAVSQLLKDAEAQDARAEGAVRTARQASSGSTLTLANLAAQPVDIRCAGARDTSICSALVTHWEAVRLRQLASATPCYWEPETAPAPGNPPQQAKAPAAEPQPAKTVAARREPETTAASSAKAAQPQPAKAVASKAAPKREPAPAASEPAGDLNASVLQASRAVDARNAAQTSAYQAARTEYEAELARQKEEAEAARRKHDEEMAEWKRQVAACKSGDYKACAK